MLKYLFIIVLAILIVILIISIIFKSRSMLMMSLILFIIYFIILVFQFKKLFMPDFIEMVDKNWSIQLPKPVNIEEIYNSRDSFHGDGMSFHILYYSSNKSPELLSSLNWTKDNTKLYATAFNFFKDNEIISNLNANNKPLAYYKCFSEKEYILLLYDTSLLKLYVIQSYV